MAAWRGRHRSSSSSSSMAISDSSYQGYEPLHSSTIMSATGAINNGAAGQAKSAGQQPNATNTLPLEIWLSRVLPLTSLQDLLPLCSTSKWLGDELKHDVVIKAALAKRGYGTFVSFAFECNSGWLLLFTHMLLCNRNPLHPQPKTHVSPSDDMKLFCVPVQYIQGYFALTNNSLLTLLLFHSCPVPHECHVPCSEGRTSHAKCRASSSSYSRPKV